MPVLPTLVVALAVAAMIGLGVWQLKIRLPEKEAELAQLAANPGRPAVLFPSKPDDRLLFRRATLDCRPPVALRRAGAGAAGFRVIATCADGATGGAQVQLGTARDPNVAVRWSGGRVSGRIGHAPDSRPLIVTLFDRTSAAMMLIADGPVVGLTANTTPDWRTVPNNHLSYAIQWFAFAGIAAVIYLLALRRRGQ